MNYQTEQFLTNWPIKKVGVHIGSQSLGMPEVVISFR